MIRKVKFTDFVKRATSSKMQLAEFRFHKNSKVHSLGLVHTSDGIASGVGIGSARSVTIQCKSKIGIGSGVGSSTESESEGSEEILFLLIPLPLPSLPIQ